MITVYIADDHPIFVKGVCDVVEESDGMQVIGYAYDGASALEQLVAAEPDIAVLDIMMPNLTGLEINTQLKQQDIDTKVVIFTSYRDKSLFDQAMEGGIKGYLLKESAVEDIVDCIKMVHRGQYFVSSKLLDLFDKKLVQPASPPAWQTKLTPAELRILKLIAEDKTSKEIAETLFISEKTVSNHRSNICEKLGLTGINSLLKYAIAHKQDIEAV